MPGVSLNEEGRQQAARLAMILSGQQIDAIYSSPLERARETADPVSEALGLPYAVSEILTEIDYGKWTDKSIEDLKNDPLFQNYNTFRSNTRVPGGELMAEAQMRIVKELEKLCAKHPGKTIAIVCHADLIKSAIAWFAGISLDLINRIEISPGSVSIIDIYDETARIRLVNYAAQI
jgi:probable phosphoglycerate mutase